MEVRFETTKAELIELAKMAYVAQYVFDSSGQFSTGYHYLYMKEFDAALRVFNKMLVQHIGDIGLVEVNEQSPEIFTHTMLMEDECEKVLNQFKEECFADTVCTALTDRDYAEQYGAMQTEEGSQVNSEAYHILYDNNMLEIQKYGLKRLRIQE